MQTITSISSMQAFSRKLKAENKTIGFVPTMGALHEGHLSLVRRAREENDITVVSIFVNPTQFGPNEDFHKYPRDAEGDLKKLSPLAIDTVFLPDAREMYPEGFSTSINVGRTGEVLCGASRPGHFNGVATVVAKLFNIVMPDRVYFGQKDFQQTAVIRKMADDLNFDTEIIVCPTVREADGLAMSSRNSYLKKEERKAATILYRALQHAETLIVSGKTADVSVVKKEMEIMLSSEPLAEIDYVAVVDVPGLNAVEKITCPVALCIAVRIGVTRLIDNIIVRQQTCRL